MLLRDLVLPIPSEEARGLALVFSPALASRLGQLHEEYGSPNCVPVPARLIDGRLMLCADILTEVQPGGLLHAMWSHADHAVLVLAVDVVPMAEVLSMIPASPIGLEQVNAPEEA